MKHSTHAQFWPGITLADAAHDTAARSRVENVCHVPGAPARSITQRHLRGSESKVKAQGEFPEEPGTPYLVREPGRIRRAKGGWIAIHFHPPERYRLPTVPGAGTGVDSWWVVRRRGCQDSRRRKLEIGLVASKGVYESGRAPVPRFDSGSPFDPKAAGPRHQGGGNPSLALFDRRATKILP